METTLFYLLRVSIATGILYASYKLILSKKTFHGINRAVLLSIVALSLTLPLLTVRLPQIALPTEKIPTVSIAPSTVEMPSESSVISANYSTELPDNTPVPISWTQYLLGTYLLGVAFSFFRLLFSYIRIRLIIRKANKKVLSNNITLCISTQKIAPFSWTRFIVIPPTDLSEDSHDIIRHEQAHLAFKHSHDLLLFNLYTMFFWFNPFAWLLRRELQITHEYQADAKVLSQGADLKNYQLLLIRKCVGEQKFALAHNFEYNNLQKRIRMTMTEKSGGMQKWLYCTLIIAVIGSIVGISCTKGSSPKGSSPKEDETVKGHIHGTFSSDSINGRMQIHTYKKTADIVKYDKGRTISQRFPGDSILAEYKVENGKFNYDYNFSKQQQVRLVFIDSKNREWKLNFINPYKQGFGKWYSNYCVFDHKANITINVMSERAQSSRYLNILLYNKRGNKNYYEISRTVEARISGSPANDKMFKQQIRPLERNVVNSEFETGIVFESNRYTKFNSKRHTRLINVSIKNLNTREETTSDKNGNYRIKAYPRNILSFSLDGYVRSNYYAEFVTNQNMSLRKKTSADKDIEGQTYSVKGEILEDNFKPIANASIWIVGTNTKCLSDKNGKYTLIAKSNDIVCIAKKGYKDTATVFINTNKDEIFFLHK